jgi:hypothetical protein
MKRSTKPALETLEGRALLTTPAPVVPVAPIVTAAEQGLVDKLTTDHTVYHLGQPVVMTLTVTNTSNHDISFGLGPSVDEGFFVTQNGKEVWASNTGFQPDWIMEYTLKPGESVTTSDTWNGQSNIGPASTPTGTLVVHSGDARVTIEIQKSCHGILPGGLPNLGTLPGDVLKPGTRPGGLPNLGILPGGLLCHGTTLTLGGTVHGVFLEHTTTSTTHYTIEGTGTLTPIGKTAITGSLDVPNTGFISSGPPGNTLTLLTGKGTLTLTLQIQGPILAFASVPTPTTPTAKGEIFLAYLITKGTGAYKGDTGFGTVEFTFTTGKGSTGAYQVGQVSITLTPFILF